MPLSQRMPSSGSEPQEFVCDQQLFLRQTLLVTWLLSLLRMASMKLHKQQQVAASDVA